MTRLFSSIPTYRPIITARSWVFNHKVLSNLIKFAVIAVVTGVLSFFIVCRVDTHMRIYVRPWLAPPQPVVIEPLSNAGQCYSRELDPVYRQGYKTHQVNYMPGFRLQDDTCFGYAATIYTTNTSNSTAATYFHTHWSSNNNRQVFGETQFATLRSFVATQQDPATTLIVWIYEQDELALTQSASWQTVKKHTDRIKYEVISDEPVSLGALAKYGGVWFDIKTLFVRDLSPLMGGNDWIAQSTCFTSVDGDPFLGSSMMYFHKDSPHLCELKSAAAVAGTTGADHGNEISRLYYRVYKRILRNGYKPWAIVPWCYMNPSQCKKPNRLESPFDNNVKLDQRMLNGIFAYQYHSNPPLKPSGTIYSYLNNKYSKTIDW